MNVTLPDDLPAQSMAVLECKFVYYLGVDVGLVPVPDQVYDQLEEMYWMSCLQADQPTSATDLVGFPGTPSAYMAASAVLSGRGVMNHLNGSKLWRPLKRCPMCRSRVVASYARSIIRCTKCEMSIDSKTWRDAVKEWNEIAG